MFDITKSGAAAEMQVFLGSMREMRVTFGSKPTRLQSVPPELFDGFGKLLEGFAVVPVARKTKPAAAGPAAPADTEPDEG